MISSKLDRTTGHLAENNYIVTSLSIPRLFSRQECEDIVELGKKFRMIESQVARNGSTGINRLERVSSVRWVMLDPESKWIFDRIHTAIKRANQYYKFDITGCNYLQVTRYPVGGYYTWHEDIGEREYSRRKLSLSVQLSDANDYTGGNLEFTGRTISDEIKRNYRQQGTAIIFPSYIAHQVTTLTTGTRSAMVAWFDGPPFR